MQWVQVRPLHISCICNPEIVIESHFSNNKKKCVHAARINFTPKLEVKMPFRHKVLMQVDLKCVFVCVVSPTYEQSSSRFILVHMFLSLHTHGRTHTQHTHTHT